MNKILIVIDAYLSNLTRASVCDTLINQIREYFPDKEILLINKSGQDYDLSKKVDFYCNHGKSFLVGYPPQELLDNQTYSIPYIFVDTGIGTCENWLPIVGIQDHVAGIYNSFIISCNIANLFGYSKIVKFEFDSNLTKEDAKSISIDMDTFQDYLFYGKRYDGIWEKPENYLVSLQVCGYSTNIFKGFDMVKNDTDYWNLCKKLGYYSKWIEYLIPRILMYASKTTTFSGIVYKEHIYHKYPNSKFEIINSNGVWEDRWKDIPKLCRISRDKGITEDTNRIGIFYWNSDYDAITTFVKIVDHIGTEVLNKEIQLNNHFWSYDELNITNSLTMTSKCITSTGEEYETTQTLNIKDINKLSCRILKNE